MKTRFFHNFLTDFRFPSFGCLPIVCQKVLKRQTALLLPKRFDIVSAIVFFDSTNT